jgi:hypothetical protein
VQPRPSGCYASSVGGDLWSLWEYAPDATTPPRVLMAGRWGENALAEVWHRALRGDGVAQGVDLERVVAAVRGEFFSLPRGWDEHPAAERLKAWAGEQAEMPARLGAFMVMLAHARDVLGPPHDWGGPSLLHALWALVERTGTGEAFARALALLGRGGTQEDVRRNFDLVGLLPPLESTDEPQVRFQPAPTLPFADAVAEWRARDPQAFAWAEAFVRYAPPHARLVTLDDRRPGTPAPGSIWWPLDPEGWVYISSRELVELETARGRDSRGDSLLPDGTALRSRQVFQAQYATWEAAESLCAVSATVLTVPRSGMALGLRRPA